MLEVNGVSYQLDEEWLIHDLSLQVKKNEWVGVIGPNGSGKSTLLKTIYRVLKPHSGFISLEEKRIDRLPSKLLAQKMAVVSQETPMLFDFTVKEIVMMGRSPHKKLLEADNVEDESIVVKALNRVGLQEKINRSFLHLSGGEKQRVMIARALTQQPDFLVLDEPTNHLDIHHQLQILDIVKALDLTVITALHDLNLALSYCDRLYVLKNGSIVASGKPENIITEALLFDVFQVQTDIRIHPVTGRKHITFLSDYMMKEKERSSHVYMESI